MSLLQNSDQIFAAAAKVKTETFHVDEWNCDVLLRELTGKERDKFELSTVERKGNSVKQNLENLRARLIILCVVNEQGERVFNPKDIDRLGDLPATGLDRLFTKCQKMNGLRQEDVEELTEGFGDDQSEPSTSD